MNTKVKYISYKKSVNKYHLIVKATLLIIIIGLSTKIIYSNNNYLSGHIDKYYLQINGSIKPVEYKDCPIQKNIDSAEIAIFKLDDVLFKKLYSNKDGGCFLKLPLNEQFKIKISKNGWVTKLINIDTRLDEDKLKKYQMLFEVEMFEAVNELNISVLNQPIANVFFNENLNKFDYGYKYTNGVNKNIEKIYLNYYKFHKKNDTTHIKSNDPINNYEYSKIPSNNSNTLKDTYNKSVSNVNHYSKNNVLDNIKSSYKTYYKNNFSGKVVYKIQILALEGSLPSCATFFGKCGKANEYFHDGKYKYTLGEFKSIETASNQLDMMKKYGYNDAFLIAFVNGKRINLTDALAIQYYIKE